MLRKHAVYNLMVYRPHIDLLAVVLLLATGHISASVGTNRLITLCINIAPHSLAALSFALQYVPAMPRAFQSRALPVEVFDGAPPLTLTIQCREFLSLFLHSRSDLFYHLNQVFLL